MTQLDRTGERAAAEVAYDADDEAAVVRGFLRGLDTTGDFAVADLVLTGHILHLLPNPLPVRVLGKDGRLKDFRLVLSTVGIASEDLVGTVVRLCLKFKLLRNPPLRVGERLADHDPLRVVFVQLHLR